MTDAPATVSYTNEDDGTWLDCPLGEPCVGASTRYRPAAFMTTRTVQMTRDVCTTHYDGFWSPTVAELAAAELEHRRDVHGLSATSED